MANKECLLFFVLVVVISVHLEGCEGRAVDRAGRTDEVESQFGNGDVVGKSPNLGRRKISLEELEGRAFNGGIRSDVIQTKFPGEDDQDQDKPGWMRRQLMRFGNIASSVSTKLGGSAAKVAGFVEKICKVMKTMIPIVAAVCNVGKFQFCTSPEGPVDLAEAMAKSNPLDLSIQD